MSLKYTQENNIWIELRNTVLADYILELQFIITKII